VKRVSTAPPGELLTRDAPSITGRLALSRCQPAELEKAKRLMRQRIE
jgi:hypothetical protein